MYTVYILISNFASVFGLLFINFMAANLKGKSSFCCQNKEETKQFPLLWLVSL